jgi:hypothetical protein
MGKLTWRKTGVYILVALPVLGLASIAVVGQQQPDPDPVAEAARKAREKKKEEPKPKKVFTNDDFSSAPPPPATPATPSNPDAKDAVATATDKDSPAKDSPAAKNSEEAWRKRFREARDKLASAEQELDILQREQQKAQVQYYSDPQKALSEQYTRKDVSDKDTKIEAKKQEIAQMKQHIADMEDELRKAGGDSGWAR